MVRSITAEPGGENLHLSRLLDGGAARGWRTWWSGPRTTSSVPPRASRSAGTGIPTAGPRAATGIAKLDSMTFDPASYVFSQPSAPTAIRASTVLPARRENVELRTADGHGWWASSPSRSPAGSRRPSSRSTRCRRTAASWIRTSSARPPTGCRPSPESPCCASTPAGPPRPGEPAAEPSRGAWASASTSRPPSRFAVERGLPNRWLVGWSFGTELALMYGASEPVASEIEGAILLSPPLHRATDVHLKEWAAAGKPLKVLVPEHDDYLQPAAAAERFAAGAAGARGGGRRREAPLGGGEVRLPRAQRDRGRGHSGRRTGGAALPQEWDGPVATAHA